MASQKTCLPPKVFGNPEILILGSLPGQKSLETQIYYANRGNRFWPMIAHIYGEEKPADSEQMDVFLERHRIALWDVYESVIRDGSSDSSMKNTVPNDIYGFLKKHPTIKRVLVAGKKAQMGFEKLNIQTAYFPVPSTSGANALFDENKWREAIKNKKGEEMYYENMDY